MYRYVQRGLLSLWLSLLFFSCQQDLQEEDLQVLISGTWYMENEVEVSPPVIFRNETTYLQDGTFSRVGKVLDASRNVLGYVSYHEGSYRIDADTLITFDTDYYRMGNESSYLELDELQFENRVEIESKSRVSFSQNYTLLKLRVICLSPYYHSSLCIDQITMKRAR
ncbi:hypothetical protein WJR50_14055 [Catalinimonas sp. 4WD22]|uniref:hypothetical protein n=1 Tax=Catalinimonas locisalis TaxID=3133978 RepID=UPI0031016538